MHSSKGFTPEALSGYKNSWQHSQFLPNMLTLMSGVTQNGKVWQLGLPDLAPTPQVHNISLPTGLLRQKHQDWAPTRTSKLQVATKDEFVLKELLLHIASRIRPTHRCQCSYWLLKAFQWNTCQKIRFLHRKKKAYIITIYSRKPRTLSGPNHYITSTIEKKKTTFVNFFFLMKLALHYGVFSLKKH